VNILKTLDVIIDSILISDLKDNTYYAVISMNKGGEVFEIDARPSDAIALAVRLGTSIFVNDSVMDEAGYVPDGSDKDLQDFKIESDQDNLESLKQKLKKAVEEEDYEKAAALRDEIKRIERGLDK
jgi:bifunctional DNase/RNase